MSASEIQLAPGERRVPSSPGALRLELLLLLAFAVPAVLLAALAGDAPERPWDVVGLVVAFGVASRLSFPIQRTVAIPTEVVLVPLLLFAGPALTPLLVYLAMATSNSLVAIARRELPLRRLVTAGGDALHSLGPSLVLLAAGVSSIEEALPWLPLAYAAQLAFDGFASWVLEYGRTGGASRFPAGQYALVWLVDLLLGGAGVMAAFAAEREDLALLGLVPLIFLFLLASVDRSRRQAENEDRLAAVSQERSRLRTAVHRIGDAFASTLDLDALLLITTRAALEAVDGGAARASTTTGVGRRLTQRVTLNEDEGLAELLATVEERAVTSGDLVHAIVGGVFAMAAPVGDVSQGGVVAIARRTHEFVAEERELFLYLCEQAGVAARSVARHESLHRQALTDDLTGLANHRRFQELLSEGHSRYRESGIRVGLVLLDIDDFKAVNDRWGHQVGDQVLRTVASAMRDACRTSDEPARYGGEELAVVVADADLHECSRLAERIRRAIEQTGVVEPSGQRLSVTASFGVAVMGASTPDPPSLIAAADAALYRAKYQGKNCVRVADDAPAGMPG